MKYKQDLIGKRFTRLIIIKEIPPGKGYKRRVLVICDCGKERNVNVTDLKTNKTKSCGCLDLERKITHNKSNTPTYKSWNSMIQRCTNPNNNRYKDYMGRGITIFEPWYKFENFLKYMGERPSLKHTIDRYPNTNGNYEPGNVRWATKSEQSLNTRLSKKTGLPRGVRLQKGKYTANIKIKGKPKYLGSFDTILAAEKKFLFAYFRAHLDLPPEYRIC